MKIFFRLPLIKKKITDIYRPINRYICGTLDVITYRSIVSMTSLTTYRYAFMNSPSAANKILIAVQRNFAWLITTINTSLHLRRWSIGCSLAAEIARINRVQLFRSKAFHITFNNLFCVFNRSYNFRRKWKVYTLIVSNTKTNH